MNVAARYLATGSVIALMTALSFTAANAAERKGSSMPDQPSMEDGASMQDPCAVGTNCAPDRIEPDRVVRPDGSERSGKRKAVNKNDNNNNDGVSKKREARSDWKYDSNRHKRHRNKDARYRYYYGGYWYLEPYWDGQIYVSNRVSCGEGREIVDDSGFSRVRTIECSGRNYTYAARRHGDTFRVSLNSRTGEIVNVRPM